MKQVTIKNGDLSLTVLDYGAIIKELIVKDKEGKPTNVVVGHKNATDYLTDELFLGACIGRYAGRLSHSFPLNGKNFNLKHENGVHLHGGQEGFSKKYWAVGKTDHGARPFVQLSYTSKHLEEGYPGNVKVTVTYQLIGKSLVINHEATTDNSTIINLTNHSYFVLDSQPNINEYQLQLNSRQFLELGSNLMPSGAKNPVVNTEYDFVNKKKMGSVRLDTPFIIDKTQKECAWVCSEASGICMQVTTNQPVMVVYTPPSFAAICVETQGYPDAPNIASFPSCVLQPGEVYRNESVYHFDIVG